MQAFALVGCLVTGTLARRRRLEVEGLNNRLRQINAELMKRGTVEVPCLLAAPALALFLPFYASTATCPSQAARHLCLYPWVY